MTQPRTFLLTLLITLVATTGATACAQNGPGSPGTPEGGGGGGSGGGSGGGGSGGGDGNGGGGGSSATSAKTTSPTTDGSVTARINGSDRISCDSIDSEITVTAQGRSQWTAAAKRTHVQSDPITAKGVTVSPASGVLESGRSTTIRVQGSFDGATKVFYVFVLTPNRSGSGGSVLEYKCR